jgi:retron-type reverse transcriptase
MFKGESTRGDNHKAESTGARYWGRAARSSDEAPVIEAYKRVKKNAGAAGTDRQSLEDFDCDRKNNLYKIWNRMSSGRDWVLGIPTVSDRIAQMVVKPQFEPEVEPCSLPGSYGYRPRKSAIQAVGVTQKRFWRYP